jgi:hypothetical protein
VAGGASTVARVTLRVATQAEEDERLARELAEQLERDAAAAEAADAAMATAAQVCGSVRAGGGGGGGGRRSCAAVCAQAEEAARLAQTLDAIAEKW